MPESPAPGADVRRLMAALPGGVALFADNGELLEANEAFLAALGDSDARPFSTRFGGSPDIFAKGTGGSVGLDGRHYAVVTRHVPDWGWLCQLQDISPWIADSAEARKAVARDALTGLANRSLFLPEVDRALAREDSVSALLMIDLDRFKSVNDTLGHAVGDALLKKVGQRLAASVRPNDIVARLGGDEFAVLQTGVAQPAGADVLAKRLVEVIGRPYIVDGHMIDIGTSIGVTVADAENAGGIDGPALFKQADIALYRAKNTGRARYTFFEQRMDEEMQERRTLELGLRRALALRQFELYYQPQLDLASNRVTGMEALIRWNHPERGLVSPNLFIPIAEETGLIVPIGEWVVRQACEDAASWPGELSVAINVSAKQLASGKLVGTVAHAIASAGIDAKRVEIEITETVLMADTANCVATLHSLRALGTRVSMDGFGTGYSSLSYLRSFPFDKIKIDQSFTRSDDPTRTDGIIRAIAAIGEHLGMTTIAEGVETMEQMGDIRASGCGSVQGFFISAPVPAGDVAALLLTLEGRSHTTVAAMPEPTASAPDTPIHRLVYLSRNAIMGVDEEVRAEVDSILAKSQRNNLRDGVTGALMFTDGYFAQVLEGERGAVEEVFERIQLDPRHADVQLLSFDRVATRLFANWSMAFVGHEATGREKFGHYAAVSGFDFTAANGDAIIARLRAMLVDEEKFALPLAA